MMLDYLDQQISQSDHIMVSLGSIKVRPQNLNSHLNNNKILDKNSENSNLIILINTSVEMITSARAPL